MRKEKATPPRVAETKVDYQLDYHTAESGASERPRRRHPDRHRHLPDPEYGKASHYMGALAPYLRRNPTVEEICIVIRESARGQKRRKNHRNYRFMRRKLEAGGYRVYIFKRTCSGKLGDPTWEAALRKVSRFAAKREALTGKPVPILAYSADRYLRNADYLNTTPELVPTVREYQELRELTGGLPLLTWIAPDTPPLVARTLQTKLGQRTKGHKGGRPKKINKSELRAQAQEMRERGTPLRTIAGKVGRSVRTVWKWLENAA